MVTASADMPAGDGERRHDPLCPAPLCDWTGEAGNDCMGYEDCHHLCQCDLIARVREDERASILTLSDRVKESQYAAALRDAAAAARKQRSKFKARDWDDAIDAVVAAIEALGGER